MYKVTNQTKHKRTAIAEVGYFLEGILFKKWKKVMEPKSLEKVSVTCLYETQKKLK